MYIVLYSSVGVTTVLRQSPMWLTQQINTKIEQMKRMARMIITKLSDVDPLAERSRTNPYFTIGITQYKLIGKIVSKDPNSKMWLVKSIGPGGKLERMSDNQILEGIKKYDDCLSVIARSPAKVLLKRRRQCFAVSTE